MSNRSKHLSIDHIHPCVFKGKKKCHTAACSIVSLYGKYPQKVCQKHIGWAKRRVQEIDAS